MAWADQLPKMVEAREAWQAEHGPRIRERDERLKNERARATKIVAGALFAGNASEDDRALVARITGLAI